MNLLLIFAFVFFVDLSTNFRAAIFGCNRTTLFRRRTPTGSRKRSKFSRGIPQLNNNTVFFYVHRFLLTYRTLINV